MERDYAKYPDNENGMILWQLKLHGDNHELPRDIEFNLDFTEEEAAVSCGIYLFQQYYKVELEPPLEDEIESPWSVLAIWRMAADYNEICTLEKELSEVARQFGGTVSGWGCHSMSAP